MRNALIKVYVNNVLKSTLPNQRMRFENKWSEFFSAVGPFSLTVELAPITLEAASSARIQVTLYNVNPSFDICLDKYQCLEKLGDGTDAAFALRNNNGLQKACLEKDAIPLFIEHLCAEWRACVHMKPKLEKFLLTSFRAAGVRGGTGAQSDAGVRIGGSDKRIFCFLVFFIIFPMLFDVF